MNNRLRLGPPKVTLPHISGMRIRPSSLPSGPYGAAGIGRQPTIAEHVRTDAVRTTMHTVDLAVGEDFLIRQLAARSDIQHMNVPLAGRPGAGDVQLLVVGREAQAVGVRH